MDHYGLQMAIIPVTFFILIWTLHRTLTNHLFSQSSPYPLASVSFDYYFVHVSHPRTATVTLRKHTYFDETEPRCRSLSGTKLRKSRRILTQFSSAGSNKATDRTNILAYDQLHHELRGTCFSTPHPRGSELLGYVGALTGLVVW